MQVMRRKEGVVVPATSEKKIADSVSLVREVFGMTGERYFPITSVYEMLWIFDPNSRFEVVEDSQMGDDDARTYPDRGLILVRESVYDDACRGQGRARFTMCHELGHLGMHRNVALSRINPALPPAIYQNSEWQADVFASHLMMPAHLMQGYSFVDDVMADFGVSRAAAMARLNKMKTGVTKMAS